MCITFTYSRKNKEGYNIIHFQQCNYYYICLGDPEVSILETNELVTFHLLRNTESCHKIIDPKRRDILLMNLPLQHSRHYRCEKP